MKISAIDFAEMLGMTRQSLNNKENNYYPWSLDDLIKICEIMKEKGITENLTVSRDGKCYEIMVAKITA